MSYNLSVFKVNSLIPKHHFMTIELVIIIDVGMFIRQDPIGLLGGLRAKEIL